METPGKLERHLDTDRTLSKGFPTVLDRGLVDSAGVRSMGPSSAYGIWCIYIYIEREREREREKERKREIVGMYWVRARDPD